MGSQSLTFRFLGKDESASSSMKKIGKEAEETGKKVSGLGKIAGGVALGNVFTEAAGKVSEFASESINKFAEVGAATGRMQRLLGVTPQFASQLNFAAQESGVQSDALTASLLKLSKNLVAGGKAWQSTGIQARDAHGQLKPMAELLPQIADKFASMPDGPQKTALALQIFGKQGAALIPLLNKGAEGIREYAKESDKLGLTMSTKDVAAVRANVKAHREMHAAVEGLQVQLGRTLYPIITQVIVAFTRWMPVISDLAKQALPALASIAGTIGSILMNYVVPALTSVAQFVERNSAVIKPLAVILGTLAAGIWLVNTATKAWAAAQALMNTVLEMNPIGLVVAAIAALVVGLVYAYRHSQTFRQIVQGAFEAVAAVAKTVFGFVSSVVSGTFHFISDHWSLLLSILTGPIGAAAIFIATHWQAIKNGAMSLVSGIGTVFSKVTGLITAPFRAAFNAISSLWNSTLGSVHFNIPGWVPGLGGDGFSFPKMPHLATGGTALTSGMALVGERGPEILSLQKGASVIPLRNGGRGQSVIQINTGPMTRDGARELYRALQQLHRDSGGAMGVA